MNYEDLLMEAEAEGLIVKEKPLKVSDGRIKGKRIAIRQDIPTYRQSPVSWPRSLDTIIQQ